MKETNEMQEKAKAFFALWQEQVAVLVRDPEAMAATMKTLLANQETYYKVQPTEMKQAHAADTIQQSDAVSSDIGALSSAELAARLAQCEARIAELESALAKRSRTTGKRTTGSTRRNAA